MLSLQKTRSIQVPFKNHFISQLTNQILGDLLCNEKRAGAKIFAGLGKLRELRVLDFSDCSMDTFTYERNGDGTCIGYGYREEEVFPDFGGCQDLIRNLLQ